MSGLFRIGRIAGIDIRIHVSWLIILVLLTFSLASGYFPVAYPGLTQGTYVLLGFVSTILLFVSVLLHELAHSLVARARGLPVHAIVLFIFGGVSDLEQEPQTAGTEFFMALVGPLTSLLIGGLCYGLLLLLRGSSSLIMPVLSYLALINILLAGFNLIPGFPLDGGRILRSIIWKVTGNLHRATDIAAIVGNFFAYLLIFFGLLQFFTGNGLGGLFTAFIGWFLLNASNATRTQATFDKAFGDVLVSQMMTTNVVTAPANISLQRLIDEYMLPQGLRSVFIMQGNQLAGLITLSDIRRIPREQWAHTLVGSTMIPVERLHTVTPQQSLKEVLNLMNKQNVNQLPVVQDGNLVGVLTREAILRSLAIRSDLGLFQKRAA